MTAYSFDWRQYNRSFRHPLQTHHGSWAKREGIIVRFQDVSGRVGWGEIAPISWFGSETIDQAIEFCHSLKGQITPRQIAEIPDELPACQFGLASALEILRSDRGGYPERSSFSYSVLLSLKDFEELVNHWGAGGAAQTLIASSNTQSSTTFKSKIGVQEIDREINQIDRLLQVLPENAKLRLDANGGLNETEADRWLEWCDSRFQNFHPQIEFLEQPLPPDRFSEMQQLSQQFATPIALDESVATIAQLQDCYQRGWRGIFVIKPAIGGAPDRLRQFCQEYQPQVVWSSALETGIGRRYIENYLIPSTGLIDRAIGFGVDQWFVDDWGQRDAESLWQEFAEVIS